MKRKLFLLFALICVGFPVMAQDANDELGRQTGLEFNHSNIAVFVNDTFLKKSIGINLEKNESVACISKQKYDKLLIINCMMCNGKLFSFAQKSLISSHSKELVNKIIWM